MKKIDPNLSNACFLVLEDDENVRDALIDDLEALGIKGKFYQASSIEEAHTILETVTPDMILSDWNLDGPSGFDFLIEAKMNDKLKNKPFVMITGNDEISGVLVAMKRGADDYLIKPWTQEELLLKISFAWEKHNSIS
ncbi:MAG: response regulator [Oligoflexia bacterium]|nr:response regulator [Oligoflexia bacterium]